MKKAEIITTINKMIKDADIDAGNLQYTNRSKSEFERLFGIASTLVETKSVHDMLAEEFTITQIALASMDGSDDPIMNRVLNYRRQMSDMIDELKLG